jgi:ABC-type transport system substrate-binding protein
MKLLRIFTVLTVGVLLLGLVACKPTATPTTAPPPAATAAPTVAPPTKAPEVVRFIFGRGGDSVQLDPAIVTDGESFRVTGQCLEPLYQFEPGSTRPIPALAEECIPNENATEWTCKLRRGVKFHDGTDFNADAVVFNFERWRFTNHPYHFPSQVFEYYAEMWGGFDDDSLITAVEKVDDYYSVNRESLDTDASVWCGHSRW